MFVVPVLVEGKVITIVIRITIAGNDIITTPYSAVRVSSLPGFRVFRVCSVISSKDAQTTPKFLLYRRST